MDRIWQWAWDRYGARYSWVAWLVAFASLLPTFLLWSFLVVAYEKSSHYVEATVVTGAAVVVLAFVVTLPVWDRSVWLSGGPLAARPIMQRHSQRPTPGHAQRVFECC